MSRWVIAFLGAWGICLAGMYIAWLLGLTLNCLFADGCLKQLSVESLFASVNIRGVFARGTLLAIAFIAITWLNRRRRQ
jgi:predicted outer membrane lipoprotein